MNDSMERRVEFPEDVILLLFSYFPLEAQRAASVVNKYEKGEEIQLTFI